MKPKTLTIAALLAFAPAASLALPANFAELHGLDIDNLEASPDVSETGFGYASATHAGDGVVVFEDAVLELSDGIAEAAHLTLGPDLIMARNISMRDGAPDPRQAGLRFDKLVAEFKGAGEILAGGLLPCEDVQSALAGRLVTIEVEGMEFVAPELSELGGVEAAGHEPERIRARSARSDLLLGDCYMLSAFRVEQAESTTFDGKNLVVDLVSSNWQPTKDSGLGISLVGEGVRWGGPGLIDIEIGRMASHVDFGMHLIENQLEFGSELAMAVLDDAMSRGGSASFEISGLDIDPRNSPTVSIFELAGPGAAQRIAGGLSLSLAGENGA